MPRQSASIQKTCDEENRARKSGRKTEERRSGRCPVAARVAWIEAGAQAVRATTDRAGKALHQRDVLAQTRGELSRRQHVVQASIHRDEPVEIALIEHDRVGAAAALEMPGTEKHLHLPIELLRLVELRAQVAEQCDIGQAILEHELA